MLLFLINLCNCELSYRHNNKLPFLLSVFSRQKINERSWFFITIGFFITISFYI